ncbi:30S ribosomal protein S17 [Thalassoglobus neptunius]|uniref:Small ribosomal subunit protein uS17 n=1 Tax=Thalassoglobus neptunius TaxID=1938619 RepID=A0A5C5X4Q5_9PLAN|nr:30S ribosomal protein S17 [Thalassoglobus neptunius]
MRTKLIGVVKSDGNPKTRRVDVERLVQHTKYRKIVRGRTVCYVHDEDNTSKIGDTVEIVECRPRSKTKRWELVRVVKSVSDVASQIKRDEKDSGIATDAEIAGASGGAPAVEASTSDAE